MFKKASAGDFAMIKLSAVCALLIVGANAFAEAPALEFKGVPVLLFNGLPYSGRIDEYGLDGHTRLRLLEKRWYKRAPAMQINLDKHYTATLNTEKGNVIIELYTRAAPVTVNNFISTSISQ